jgi:hypothetical protein
MSIRYGVMRFQTYLEWINSPRPSDGGEETRSFAHATRLERRKHQQGQYINTYQVPLATQMALVLEGQVGCRRYFEIQTTQRSSSRQKCKNLLVVEVGVIKKNIH